MRQKIFLLIILVCAIAFAGSNRGYGFLMLEEPLSARKISMGSAGTALGGEGMRYYNPVSPFFSAHSYASIEFGQMPGGVNKGGFESALVFPYWYTAFGLYSSSVDFETRDEKGFGSQASSNTTIGSLGAGFIRGRLAVGVSAQMVQDRIWVSNTYKAFTLSGGLGYKLLDGKLNLGAAGFHGIAMSNGFGDSASVWHDGLVPRFARAGAAWMDTVKSFPFTVAADIVYRDENNTISVPVGAEVWVLPYIALRVGKRFGWESEIFSLGIGLNIDKVSFDAAFVPSVLADDYELKWSMGLSYKLGGKNKVKFAPLKIIADEEFEQNEKLEVDKQESVIVDVVNEITDTADTVIDIDDENLPEIEDGQNHRQEESQLDKQESVGDSSDESVNDNDAVNLDAGSSIGNGVGDENLHEKYVPQSNPQEKTGIDKKEPISAD